MDEELIIFEQEGDEPENWETDTIFIRNNKGEVVEVNIPDDKED